MPKPKASPKGKAKKSRYQKRAESRPGPRLPGHQKQKRRVTPANPDGPVRPDETVDPATGEITDVPAPAPDPVPE